MDGLATRKINVMMAPKPIRSLGRHILVDLYECAPTLLSFPAESEKILLRAAAAMGATVISSNFHAFPPHGVSGVVVIAESHLTIHTWPEYSYAAVDIFSCGDLDLEAGIELLTPGFKAGRIQRHNVDRGINLFGMRAAKD